jgi:hypothetical protein
LFVIGADSWYPEPWIVDQGPFNPHSMKRPILAAGRMRIPDGVSGIKMLGNPIRVVGLMITLRILE